MTAIKDALIGARFLDRGGAVFNVMHPDFGAVGDGVADDGVAWNLARAAVPTSGGIVVVPPGSYLLTTAFTFAAQSNVSLWILPGVILTGSALPTPSGTNSIVDFRLAVLSVIGKQLGIETSSPIKVVHVQKKNLGLTAVHLGEDTETIDYVLVGESTDAVIALASENEGDHGSGIDLLEVNSGVLANRWTIVRHTTGSTAGDSILAFYFGTDNFYPSNIRLVEWLRTGNFIFRDADLPQSSDDLSYLVGAQSSLVIFGIDPRLRAVGEDQGTWGAAVTLDQVTPGAPGANFDNSWSWIRQSDVGGDGRLVLTYGTNPDPALNATILRISTGGVVNFEGNDLVNIEVILIGTTTPATGSPVLDVFSADDAIQLVLGDLVTDAAQKEARIGMRHYTNAEEVVTILQAAAGISASTLRFGGGAGNMNAATSHEFYTAANNTTLSGTKAVEITGVGATSTLRTVGHLKCDAVFRQATVTTLDNNATPTVATSNLFKTGGTTTITDFDNGVVGQTIRILSEHAITITDGTNILLNGSVNFVMAAGDVLVLTMYNDQVWVEDSRQVN